MSSMWYWASHNMQTSACHAETGSKVPFLCFLSSLNSKLWGPRTASYYLHVLHLETWGTDLGSDLSANYYSWEDTKELIHSMCVFAIHFSLANLSRQNHVWDFYEKHPVSHKKAVLPPYCRFSHHCHHSVQAAIAASYALSSCCEPKIPVTWEDVLGFLPGKRLTSLSSHSPWYLKGHGSQVKSLVTGRRETLCFLTRVGRTTLRTTDLSAWPLCPGRSWNRSS